MPCGDITVEDSFVHDAVTVEEQAQIERRCSADPAQRGGASFE